MDWDMMTIVFIALGGAIGAVLRYGVGHSIDSSDFPYGTLIVNITGCFLLAFLSFRFGNTMPFAWKMFLFTGLFGAFTTFSTFTLETVNLFYDGFLTKAVCNVVANGGCCLIGALAGRYLALFL